MDHRRPDVLLLCAEWPERAQLIEEGFEVVAIDAWPVLRLYRQTGMKPRVLVIDLLELPDPRQTLDVAPSLIPSDRVLVVTALGTLTADDVRQLGFSVTECPATIGQIVARTGALLSATPRAHSGS